MLLGMVIQGNLSQLYRQMMDRNQRNVWDFYQLIEGREEKKCVGNLVNGSK